MAETADRLPQSAPALPGAHALFTPEVFLPELSRRLAEAPDARTVLVPDMRNEDLRFLDRATRRELGRIPLPGAGPQGMRSSCSGRVARRPHWRTDPNSAMFRYIKATFWP